MEQELKRKTTVIGHRNPDTDSDLFGYLLCQPEAGHYRGCVHSGQGRPCERRDQVCPGLLRHGGA